MEYRGHTVRQASNGHIQVLKDGAMVMHIHCTEQLTEDELKEQVDTILALAEEYS